MADRPAGPEGEQELERIRKRIDGLDLRIIELIDERAALAVEAGRVKRALGRKAIRDPEREREVLLRVSMAKQSTFPTADLIAIYRRLMAGMRHAEGADRTREANARRLGLDGSSEPDRSR